MKHKVLVIFLIFSGIGGLIVACQSELTDSDWSITRWLNGNNAEEIDKAKNWYEQHTQEVFSTRSGNEHPLFEAMEPFWQESYTGQNEKEKTVETVLNTIKRKRFVTPEAELKYQETGDLRYLQCMTRLIIKTDIKTQKTIGFFMTIIPSIEYLEYTKFYPFCNTYTKRSSHFDGLIIYHELNGQFANGWKYTDGKIIGKISEDDESINPLTRAVDNNCEIICTPTYEETCIEYHQVTKWSDNILDVTCYIETEDMYCMKICYIPSSPPTEEGESGSGGGSSEGRGEYDPTKKNKCPVCGNILADCICPKDDCNETMQQNAQAANNLWNTFKNLDIKAQFIDQYQQEDIEYQAVLDYDVINQTYVLNSAKTSGNSNSSPLNCINTKDRYSVASIHNHPRSLPPSMSDVLGLAKANKKTEGKFQALYILGKKGYLYVLSVQDTSKARKFYEKCIKDYGGTDSNESERKKNAENYLQQQQANIHKQIILDDRYSTSSLYEDEFKPYEVACILEQEDSGIVLLECEKPETTTDFKQRKMSAQTEGTKTIYTRSTCK